MKYRVHTYQTIRVTYEVEADSAEAAYHQTMENGYEMSPDEVNMDNPEWADEMVVDPLLENGKVDYDNVVNFSGQEKSLKKPSAPSL
jgi:hypothetical protein